MSSTADLKYSRTALNDWTRTLQYMKQLDTCRHTTVLSIIRELATSQGDRPALIGESEELSYRELVDRSDHYGNWAMSQDFDAGDVVCLLMPNCPDYVAIWLGVTEVGCAVALINTGLVGNALVHSIRQSGSRRIIVGKSLISSVMAIRTELPIGMSVWVHGDDEAHGFSRIDDKMAWSGAQPAALPQHRSPSRSDRALLISTSGTTGLPKSANITHSRVLEWSIWFAGMMDVRPEDRLYDCLPLYHSIGGVVAIGSMLSQGASVVIRTRFSVRHFWNDIVESGCTIFQYIGELCRYLARAPKHPMETAHRLRLCCGNGLRGDVWQDFQGRFQVPRILEFYAATEGHVSLYNCEGKVGAIGRIPAFLAHRFPMELIRSDVDTGRPYRTDAGLCVRCVADEPGEAIGLIGSKSSPSAREFDGYTDREASGRKVLRDVFVKGDRWFRTGDLMRRDRAGYYYFIDRIGDTYRWKGENVSTLEVAGVIEACPGVTSAVVYGVTIPRNDGRAGMAAITIDESFNFAVLQEYLCANLPEYTHPIFIRLCRIIHTTGTYRPKKGPLMRAGISLAPEIGSLWFNDRDAGAFVACDEPLLLLVQDGTLRI